MFHGLVNLQYNKLIKFPVFCFIVLVLETWWQKLEKCIFEQKHMHLSRQNVNQSH